MQAFVITIVVVCFLIVLLYLGLKALWTLITDGIKSIFGYKTEKISQG